MGRTFRGEFKLSKRLLNELVKYMSNSEIAVLIGVKTKMISVWAKQYKIQRVKTRKIPHIPEWILDEVQEEKRIYNLNHEDAGCEIIPDNLGECVVVPKEVFREPAKKERVIPKIITWDIPAFINSGMVMDWLYGGKKYGSGI